ncbi:MAG: hypothetical protein V4696_01640 [Pseudomonadota bacterium]
MSVLLILAEQCEDAAGPSFALETDIALAVGAKPHLKPLPFTASLDAAMTLIEQGASWSLWWSEEASRPASVAIRKGNGPLSNGIGTSPALALCAAALRARHEVAS